MNMDIYDEMTSDKFVHAIALTRIKPEWPCDIVFDVVWTQDGGLRDGEDPKEWRDEDVIASVLVYSADYMAHAAMRNAVACAKAMAWNAAERRRDC